MTQIRGGLVFYVTWSILIEGKARSAARAAARAAFRIKGKAYNGVDTDYVLGHILRLALRFVDSSMLPRAKSRITGIDSDCVFGHILRLALPRYGDASMLPHQPSL